MIVRGNERVLIQGITGKQGTFWTERMAEYGTSIVAGVNPKKAGTTTVMCLFMRAPATRCRARASMRACCSFRQWR